MNIITNPDINVMEETRIVVNNPTNYKNVRMRMKLSLL